MIKYRGDVTLEEFPALISERTKRNLSIINYIECLSVERYAVKEHREYKHKQSFCLSIIIVLVLLFIPITILLLDIHGTIDTADKNMIINMLFILYLATLAVKHFFKL